MKPLDLSTCTEEALWRWIALELKKLGIETVLVGGAVVAVYSLGAYKSGDLDLVVETFPLPAGPAIDAAFRSLGFARRGMLYSHPDCQHLTVQVLPGPLHVGKDHDVSPVEHVVESHVIKILSPTDIVKDRLASCLYFNAQECLDQAELVARAQEIHWPALARWAGAEHEAMPTLLQALQNRMK